MAMAQAPPPALDAELPGQVLQIVLGDNRSVDINAGGWSMGPTLAYGAKICVEPLSGAPRIGDVLLTRHGDRHVVHRLIKVTGGDSSRYVTKGDNNPFGDPPVGAGDILGRVTRVQDGATWRIPLHWRQPISAAVALYLYIEAGSSPGLQRLLRLPLAMIWRVDQAFCRPAVKMECNRRHGPERRAQMKANPKQNAALQLRELSDGRQMLYDAAGKQVHALNHSAQFVFQRCDGAHSVEAIVVAAQGKFNAPPEKIREDVHACLQVFYRKNIVQET